MAEEPESTVTTGAADESLLDKITEKLHGHDSSSSSSPDSDSDSEKTVTSSVKDKVFRLFGRERPVHSVFGAGKRKTFFLFIFSCSLIFVVVLLRFGFCEQIQCGNVVDVNCNCWKGKKNWQEKK